MLISNRQTRLVYVKKDGIRNTFDFISSNKSTLIIFRIFSHSVSL